MPIVLDFETFYSRKLKYGLRQQIAEQYCRSELFDCYLLSVFDGSTSWCGHPNNFNWSALDGEILLSHNAYFDSTVYSELVKRGLAPIVAPAAWHCTANLTSYICLRRSLEDAAVYLLNVKADKRYRAITDGRHWPDFSAEEQDIIRKGGISDAQTAHAFWTKFSDQWPERERRLSQITIDQGKRGVAIDVPKLNRYISQSHELRANTEQLIPWIRDAEDDEWVDFSAKPTATKCIAEQCRRSGIPSCPVKADDEEAYEEWESTYAPNHAWIRAITAWRSINRLYQTFCTMKSRLRPDGTMPFELKYFGAHTGRWAGGAKINFQNLNKKPIFANESGQLEMDVKRIDSAINQFDETGAYPEWVKFDIDFRSLIIPRPGRRMIVSDLSQIEPRVLAWLCGNTRLLDMVKSGYGIYEAFARANMGYDGPKWDNAFKKTDYYKMIKIQVLGLGYGAGWEKFIAICSDGGVDITEHDPEFVEETDATGEVRQASGYGRESKRVVADFRAKNTAITGLWKRLDESFRRSVGEDYTMELPSGRKLRYEGVRCARRIERDKATGRPRTNWIFTADVGGKRRPLYGGKLTENITQAVARDVFAEGLLRIDDNGWTTLFTSHDEAILEVDESISPRDVEAVMSVTPDWMPGLPVAAEAKVVSHYLK